MLERIQTIEESISKKLRQLGKKPNGSIGKERSCQQIRSKITQKMGRGNIKMIKQSDGYKETLKDMINPSKKYKIPVV